MQPKSFSRGNTDDARSLVRIRYRFVGRVQAVGFRWNTANLARRNGATGWVRNEPDGSVIAEMQGDPTQIDAVIDGLNHHYNASIWYDSGGFQVASREYLPLVEGETSFHVTY